MEIFQHVTADLFSRPSSQGRSVTLTILSSLKAGAFGVWTRPDLAVPTSLAWLWWFRAAWRAGDYHRAGFYNAMEKAIADANEHAFGTRGRRTEADFFSVPCCSVVLFQSGETLARLLSLAE